MKHRYRIMAALFAGGVCLSAMANITASLDRSRTALGETVQLSLQSDGDTTGEPDLAPLKQDFDVLGASHGTSVQIVNGSKSEQTQVVLELAPKHAGAIRIPPLQWGAQRSQAIDLTVAPAGAGQPNRTPGSGSSASGGASPVFLTAAVDQKQPYVQGAVLLTVKLYAGEQIEQAGLDMAGNGDVQVKQVGSDRQSSEVRDGRDYEVVQRQYILLPQRSGRITLNGPALDAKVQSANGGGFDIDSFFRNPFGAMAPATQSLHLRGDPIELNVLARPAADSGNWLPAQQVNLEESWQPAQGVIHAGDPVTLHLRLTATGLTGAQLPDLAAAMRLPDGVKMYPDRTSSKDTLQDGRIVGSREQDIALIASAPGRIVVPGIKLSWWDTVHKLRREADLPARTLDVLPAAASTRPVPGAAPGPAIQAGNEAPPTQAAAAATAVKPAGRAAPSFALNPWQWLCVALAVLWAGTALVWWRSRRRDAGSRSEARIEPGIGRMTETAPAVDAAGGAARVNGRAGKSLEALAQACRGNDATAARRALLDWAAGVWPEAPPRGLNALGERLDDADLQHLLRQLDRACYAGEAWQGAPLAQAFETPPKPKTAEKTGAPIPGLYADS